MSSWTIVECDKCHDEIRLTCEYFGGEPTYSGVRQVHSGKWCGTPYVLANLCNKCFEDVKAFIKIAPGVDEAEQQGSGDE